MPQSLQGYLSLPASRHANWNDAHSMSFISFHHDVLYVAALPTANPCPCTALAVYLQTYLALLSGLIRARCLQGSASSLM